MTPTRAVLFDFGGTLYDYASLLPGDAESLWQLCEWAGVSATPEEVRRAQRESMRRVFHAYLPRRYYLHRDLFRDAVVGTLEALGVAPQDEHLERYREMQWRLHARDFRLREGVVETLTEMRRRGLHVGMVSNIDDDQLDHLIDVAGLRAHFDSLLSSERAGSCKPDPGIFTQALERAGCAAGEALFVGDTLAADIAGANRMGMRSALIWHRADKPPPADGERPHHVIRTIPELLDLLPSP
ncbi:MAG: HAD family hydrolase [Deltaproteobacteria bacterium]|nr:HAD family hydrolase [Deltaproteobacteria bacterium]